MTIYFDLGGVSNHDNMNAVPAIDTVIAAGSVIDDTGSVVSGVSFSLAANPFLAVSAAFDGGDQFTEVNTLAHNRFLSLNAAAADAEPVISGLPAGDYTVTVFGARNTASNAPATMSLNGQTGVDYNAANTGTYADHIAVDTITLDGSTDLAINISHVTGQGTYAYANLITIEDVTPPTPTVVSVDSDNEINPSQTDVSVAISNAPASVTSLDQINLGGTVSGETITGGTNMLNLRWNGGTPLFDVPAGMTIANGYDIHVKYTP